MSDFKSRYKLTDVGLPASFQTIRELERDVGFSLPAEYVEILQVANGFALSNGVIIYAAEDIPERNRTFEVKTYAPGYFAIGDDSGGRLLMLNGSKPGIWIVDDGSVHPNDMIFLNYSFGDWIDSGFPLRAKPA